MSYYWDKAQKAVQEDFESINAIESAVINDVNLVIGDLWFPTEYREAILQKIFVLQNSMHERMQELNSISKTSALIEELHSQFHDIANLKQDKKQKYVWSDSPATILVQRNLEERIMFTEGMKKARKS